MFSNICKLATEEYTTWMLAQSLPLEGLEAVQATHTNRKRVTDTNLTQVLKLAFSEHRSASCFEMTLTSSDSSSSSSACSASIIQAAWYWDVPFGTRFISRFCRLLAVEKINTARSDPQTSRTQLIGTTCDHMDNAHNNEAHSYITQKNIPGSYTKF